jgi:hypothetical protein
LIRRAGRLRQLLALGRGAVTAKFWKVRHVGDFDDDYDGCGGDEMVWMTVVIVVIAVMKDKIRYFKVEVWQKKSARQVANKLYLLVQCDTI